MQSDSHSIHFSRPRLDRGQQRLVGQVAVAGRALVIGVPENLPDGEQIDAGIDHERRRRMAQIVDAQVAQPRVVPGLLPAVLYADEGLTGVEVGKQRGGLELSL